MWYLTVAPGKPIIGFQPDPAEDLEPVTDEHMEQLHLCPPDWVWDAGSKTLVPQPAPPPVDSGPRVPESITMRQCRLILLQRNLLDNVNQAVAGTGSAAEIEWEYATDVPRNHPLVAGIAQLLNFSGDQMDQMFIEASTL